MRFLLLLSLSLLAFGCSKKEGKLCPEDGICGDGLRCEPATKTCQSICGKPSDCGKGLNCDESIGICFSKFDRAKTEECRRSKPCKYDGECLYVDGSCKANKADCAESMVCKDLGLCGLSGGECRATKDEDCARSWGCKIQGECSAVDGECRKK